MDFRQYVENIAIRANCVIGQYCRTKHILRPYPEVEVDYETPTYTRCIVNANGSCGSSIETSATDKGPSVGISTSDSVVTQATYTNPTGIVWVASDGTRSQKPISLNTLHITRDMLRDPYDVGTEVGLKLVTAQER